MKREGPRRRLAALIHEEVARHLEEHLHEHLHGHHHQHPDSHHRHGEPSDEAAPGQRAPWPPQRGGPPPWMGAGRPPPWAGGPPPWGRGDPRSWSGGGQGPAPPWGNPDFWRHMHARRQALRHRWRRFSGAHLRRRLFLWFGATIALTTIIVGWLAHFARAGAGPSRIPYVLFLVVPIVILWAATGKVARRIARPLDELVRVAQDIGRGRLDARVRLDRSGIDEIAELSRAVNDMATRIEAQLADQRELLAGVSHEIRTPLARLRLLVEIARERGAAATNLDEIERELIEIDALVGELLASARLDFRAVSAVPLDAREVALRAAERAGVPAERVSIDVAETAFAGDPTLLARALANLLQNARVHAGGVDRVVVRGAPDGTAIELGVLDRGPGFAAGEEQRIFERFYRKADPAAEAGSGGVRADGLGLGLALVRRIAEAHGGGAAARNRADGRGAEVSLWVPRSPPAARAT